MRERLLWTLQDDTLEQQDLIDAMVEFFTRDGAPLTADVFARQCDACLRHDAADRLRQIRQRTLVICGRQDALTPPKFHRELADEIPGAQLVTIALRRAPGDGRVGGELQPRRAPVPGGGARSSFVSVRTRSRGSVASEQRLARERPAQRGGREGRLAADQHAVVVVAHGEAQARREQLRELRCAVAGASSSALRDEQTARREPPRERAPAPRPAASPACAPRARSRRRRSSTIRSKRRRSRAR